LFDCAGLCQKGASFFNVRRDDFGRERRAVIFDFQIRHFRPEFFFAANDFVANVGDCGGALVLRAAKTASACRPRFCRRECRNFPIRRRGFRVEEIFGKGGLIAKHHKDYEYRAGQIKMAEAVLRAFEEKKHLSSKPEPERAKRWLISFRQSPRA
jgi:hypothetical protein